ncbi:MAG TPA: LuxR C-terminal-related transcriptional regulator [Ktedonobacteraceae bacterium]|jgi:two-component system nitrate/nitrite response regulator NarL|nr:LuxR C-terminal-related transcriptional regulator [Ktedonobacteraceae bacterium]
MGLSVLIAEPSEILRTGLRTIYIEDPRVAIVHDTATYAGLRSLLCAQDIDFAIVNQSLVTDVTILPRGNFVILAAEPDMVMLKTAFRHGVRGYLSNNVSAELLRMALHSSKEELLIEPILAPWVLEFLFGDTQYAVAEELLTPREREIINLLRGGVDRRAIAQHLNIAETTLKTHLKNIARKRETERNLKESSLI